MISQQRIFILSLSILLLTMGCSQQKQDTPANTPAGQNTETAVVYKVPGMEEVIIKKGIEYFAEQGISLTVDMYYPPGFDFGSNLPAVLVVYGFSNDVGLNLIQVMLIKPIKGTLRYITLLSQNGFSFFTLTFK